MELELKVCTEVTVQSFLSSGTFFPRKAAAGIFARFMAGRILNYGMNRIDLSLPTFWKVTQLCLDDCMPDIRDGLSIPP